MEHGISPTRRHPGSDDIVSAGIECFRSPLVDSPMRGWVTSRIVELNGGQYVRQRLLNRLPTGTALTRFNSAEGAMDGISFVR